MSVANPVPTNRSNSLDEQGSTMGSMDASGASKKIEQFFTIRPELNNKWRKVLPTGKNIIYTSLIGKKNPMGFLLSRQLILTDQPSLFYVDQAKMVVKGEIDWKSAQPPRAVLVSTASVYFHVHFINMSISIV